jgi:integrase
MAKKRAVTERIHLTDRRIEALVVPASRRIVYDAKSRELGLKLEPTGKKTFFWFRAVPEEGKPAGAGKPTWRTIGESPSVSLDAARMKASEYSAMLARWKMDGCRAPSPFKAVATSDAPTFRELVEAYVENQIKPNSLNPARADYEIHQMVNKRLSAWLDLPIDQINVEMVLAAKRSCGKFLYAQRALVKLISTIFRWSAGTRDGKLNFAKVENPAADVSIPKSVARKRFLQPEELVEFNAALAMENPLLRDVATLLLATGARKSNVYAMRWADISFALGVWHVPISKNGEGYEVNLTPVALAVIKRRREEIDDEAEEFVFPARSLSGHTQDVKKSWAAFRKRCALADVRLHDLRRTRGSYLAIGGVSLQQIAGVLGHKSLGSTQIYARLHNEAVAKALETGDAVMDRMTRDAETDRMTRDAEKTARRSKQKLLTE